MLLHPRNSMEDYCQQLKLNIDDIEPTKYFLCENIPCSTRECGNLMSIFRDQRCSCEKLMNREVSPKDSVQENGFVNETATFIICDDLSVLPNVLGTSVDLLRKFGIKDMEAIEEQTVDVSKTEVVDLLKLSLLSKTPLTDFIFEKKPCVDNFDPINQSWLEILGEESSDEGRKMVVKAVVRKSDSKLVFAEAEEDFADLLFSFLTFPLGGVLHMLKGCSFMSCIDKLYKSVSEMNPDRYLRSQGLKYQLANPQCALQFDLHNQILPICAVSFPRYRCETYYDNGKWCLGLGTSPAYPRLFIKGSSSHEGFAKGPSMFMVTDDLVVTPMSSLSGVSYLN